jgi:DnaJ-class molecular chaperone
MVLDYYEILGLNRSSTAEEIKRAYKCLALKYHPDKSNDSERFKLINEAYQILSDPSKRSMYDMTSSFTNEENSSFLNNIFNILSNMMKEKMKEKTNKKSELELIIPVTLDEIYRCETKKIIVKVKRKCIFESIPLYFSLVNYDREIIFEKMGDEDELGNRINIRIKLDIKTHNDYYIDNVISKYDIINTRYIDLSLYDYYVSNDLEIDYLNGEKIVIKKDFSSKDINLLVIKVANKGLSYLENGEILYGDLFIYFKLILPDKDSIPIDLLKTYFN